MKTVVTGKIVGQFHLAANIEIRAAKMLADVVPDLRLGKEYKLSLFVQSFHKVHDILTPDIGESAETKALDTEQVLHAPHESELHGKLARGAIVESFIQQLEIECVAEILAVKEVIQAKEEVLVAKSNTAIVFYMEAERRKGCPLPEIQATGNFHVTSTDTLVDFLFILGIEIIVDEEESISPIVIVESL